MISITSYRFILNPSFSIFLLLLLCTSCRQESKQPSALRQVIIQNDDIQDQQDISAYFSAQIVIVSGEGSGVIPGKVRHFDFFDDQLFLMRQFPVGQIIAINKTGGVNWQLKANSDPLTAFSTLTGFHLDRMTKRIAIYDEGKRKVFYYDLDGQFIASEDLPGLYFTDVAVLGDEATFFNITAVKNEFENDDEKVALVGYRGTASPGDPPSPLLQQEFFFPDQAAYLDFSDFFTSGNDSVYYHRNFDDTLFLLNPKLTVAPAIRFSFAENDRRKEAVADPNISVLLQAMYDQNIPHTQFAVILSDYFLAGYTYNMEEIFTLIDLQSDETLINTQTYHCEGKVFKGRLDYEGGVLLNQMFAEDYRALRSAMSDGPKDRDGLSEVIATLDSEAIIYTILTPKWR